MFSSDVPFLFIYFKRKNDIIDTDEMKLFREGNTVQFFKHLMIKLAGLLLLFGIPAYFLAGSLIFGNEGADVISSATQISADMVSGEYIVLINEDMHKKRGTTEDWIRFFQGESPLIFDDISCFVSSSDGAGLEFARICQARLPENQMTLHQINGLLMVSKAEYAKFDIIIMSKEFAQAYSADSFDGLWNIKTVMVSGE